MHSQVVKIQVNSNHGPRGKDWATMEAEVLQSFTIFFTKTNWSEKL